MICAKKRMTVNGAPVMTYNFDPDTWYANELDHLDGKLRDRSLSAGEYEVALADLDRRYEELVDRLDGTYDVIGSSAGER